MNQMMIADPKVELRDLALSCGAEGTKPGYQPRQHLARFSRLGAAYKFMAGLRDLVVLNHLASREVGAYEVAYLIPE